MNPFCNIYQRERKNRQGRAAASCSSSREQMRSLRFREQRVAACNLLGYLRTAMTHAVVAVLLLFLLT